MRVYAGYKVIYPSSVLIESSESLPDYSSGSILETEIQENSKPVFFSIINIESSESEILLESLSAPVIMETNLNLSEPLISSVQIQGSEFLGVSVNDTGAIIQNFAGAGAYSQAQIEGPESEKAKFNIMITYGGELIIFNSPPEEPLKSLPEDSAINQEYINLNLKWDEAEDPDLGDTVFYNVYLGIQPDSLGIVSTCNRILALTCELNNLASNMIYYWDVVAYDNNNAKSHNAGEGAQGIFQFTTKSLASQPVPDYQNLPTETIIYDNRIILNPPPGFAKLKADISQEKVVPD